jgi:hypothetical protein
VNGEDSPVGRRAVRRYPEGNFPSPRREYRVRALHVGPRNEGMAYSRVREGRGIRLCRTRYRSNWSVQIPGDYPLLDGGRTRVVPSTVPRRRWQGATANGAGFGMPSPPRLRGRYRPSPVTGRGTVRTTNGSEPRTPLRVCYSRWRAWNRPYRREAAPVLPIDTLRDWLGIRYDAGHSVVFGRVASCTARIPALKGEDLRLFSRNLPENPYWTTSFESISPTWQERVAGRSQRRRARSPAGRWYRSRRGVKHRSLL